MLLRCKSIELYCRALATWLWRGLGGWFADRKAPLIAGVGLVESETCRDDLKSFLARLDFLKCAFPCGSYVLEHKNLSTSCVMISLMTSHFLEPLQCPNSDPEVSKAARPSA